MKGASRRYIRQLISRLTALGYMHDDGYLSAAARANDVLFGGARVTMRGGKPETAAKGERASRQAAAPRCAVSESLLLKLKELRLEMARAEKVPAFVIFSDATLVDMCGKRPRSEEELLQVSGVGQVKLKRYGGRFLRLLCEEEPIADTREKTPELTLALFWEEVELEANPLQISRAADHINAVLLRYGRPKVSGQRLNKLLIEAGYLDSADGVKLPTDSGRALGITTVERHSDRGNYTQCLFGTEAQRVCAELALKEVNDDV
jgi:ATP-dependent DNA helicase RecQ